MMGADIRAEEFEGVLATMREEFATNPLSDEMAACGEPLREAFARNFSRGGNVETVWPPHAPLTVALYGPHPLLILSGAMRMATTEVAAPGHVAEVGSGSLSIGVDLDVIPYARAQNYGFAQIPQREYLVADDEALDSCVEIIGSGLFQSVINAA